MIFRGDLFRVNREWLVIIFLTLALNIKRIGGHEAKDFDDSILYQIDFEPPKPEDLVNNSGTLTELHSTNHERFVCHIPSADDRKEEKNTNDRELSPLRLLQPIFATVSCSFRLEAYWSYEICHGHHVRQYHEEREGKNLKSQEFYLGRWTDEKTLLMMKAWDNERKAGVNYKTTKIDNIKYPYYEMEFTDGTMCDIINAPRTTLVRYVCYPHGKNEIYSFKEISSCHYEAIILTSVLCLIPAFHPEKTKELTIKCHNPESKTHKPLNMLMSEFTDLLIPDSDIPMPKEAKEAAAILMHYKTGSGVSYSNLLKYKFFLDKMVNKFYQMGGPIMVSPVDTPGTPTTDIKKDYRSLISFISGENCLTGVTGWWKYEFCYGRYIRQFHKDKNSKVELILGFFSEESHKKWLIENPDKKPNAKGAPNYVWHHYDSGTRCDRTNQRREVDVKLTCVTNANSPNAVSMYLLEPKTCVYILVVDSPIICDLIKFADEYGVLSVKRFLSIKKNSEKAEASSAAENPEIERTPDPAEDLEEKIKTKESGEPITTESKPAEKEKPTHNPSLESVDVINVLV